MEILNEKLQIKCAITCDVKGLLVELGQASELNVGTSWSLR